MKYLTAKQIIFTNTIYKFGTLTDEIDYFNNEEYIFS